MLVLGACADGGEENRPQSEVRFSATHHLFGFRALRGFGSFPVPGNAVFSDRGTLNLFDDSTYTLARSNGTSSPDRYALENSGELSIYVTGAGREPSVVFKGAYGRVGAGDVLSPGVSPELFFTDRVVTGSSPSVGIYVGTRRISGVLELEGAWHLLSLHAVFNQTIQSPDNVGRGAHGGVVIAAGAPGSVRGISGTGLQGATQLTFGGTIQNLLTNGSGDGTCNLTVDYTISGQTDSRVMLAGATNNVVLALDEDESDNESGLLFLVRKFLAPVAAVDSVRVPGTFLVGGQTLFVNPSNSGADAFVGRVTLTAAGGFRLDAIGNTGSDFSYSGTYSLAQDGGMTISISGTNETWFAAIDRSYNTFAFVDDFVETRSNNIPELNLGFGVREKVE